nr:protein kinase [Actinomycetota bacterium]
MVGGPALLGGRYRLGERIAAGGMGTVYTATDERLGRQVAVKVLRDELADDDRFVERFRREARAAASLTHPNVAAVFDYGGDGGRLGGTREQSGGRLGGTRERSGGRPFIVMELARGRDLAMLLREEGPLAPERAAAIGAQVCDALAHAHAAGLVHRDVKPANVIVDEADAVKVTDFGIARAAGESTLTVTGSVLGSAHYIAPEQASGGQVTAATDVYAAGILLYEMLTNALPFTGESALAIAMRHVSDEVPAPSAVNPRVPEWLDGIVARATAKDPAARWADARDMAEALR